jgi:O-methyltransferase
MKNLLLRLLLVFSPPVPKILLNFIFEIFIIQQFIFGDYGAAYKISRITKFILFLKIYRNFNKIVSATSRVYHIILMREIFNLPKEVEGDLIECGSYCGATTSTLSLAAKFTNRRLLIYDSFQGLPFSESRIIRDYPHLKSSLTYKKGMYAGSLKHVQKNISLYGEIGVCKFYKGLFSKTLKNLNSRIAFAFIDVDLTSSMRDCIKYIWPHLSKKGLFYTDDSCDMEVVRIWFDDNWWEENLKTKSPGYIGSGCGIAVNADFSSIGYIVKN